VRPRIDVKEGQSPSDIADKLHENLVVEKCDLIASSYSEGRTLAKGLAAVDVGDANEQEKYKQFFLLVFDFASPAYGRTRTLYKDIKPQYVRDALWIYQYGFEDNSMLDGALRLIPERPAATRRGDGVRWMV
jgi:hypothetical protein